MANRRRATLRGAWWLEQAKTLRHCYACGRALIRRWVVDEKRFRKVCSRCGAISYLNPKVVAGVIPVLPDGRVVLLRRAIEPARGKWTWPAGFQELGESVAQGAVREAEEEICVRLKLVGDLGVYSYPDAGVVTIVFIGKIPHGQIPAAGQESLDVAAFRSDAIPWKDLAFRSTHHALEDWLSTRGRRVGSKWTARPWRVDRH